jgi:hypothetical protein
MITTTDKSVALGGATTARRKGFLAICSGKLRGLAQIVKVPTYLAFCHKKRGYALGAIGGSPVEPFTTPQRVLIRKGVRASAAAARRKTCLAKAGQWVRKRISAAFSVETQRRRVPGMTRKPREKQACKIIQFNPINASS